MDYNTSRNRLILPEYGRNIQRMVEFAKAIEDDEERNRAAQAIIAVMGNMNPHLRDINDFKHKLWDHLAIMSDFNMNIESPYPLPTIEKLTERPERIPYKTTDVRYKHYGRVVEMLIDKTADFEDKDEQELLLRVIGAHMKRSYYQWNNENVAEETIIDSIREYAKGKVIVPDDFQIEEPKETRNKRKK